MVSGNEYTSGLVEHLTPLREKKMILFRKMGVLLLALALSALVLIGAFTIWKNLISLTLLFLLGVGALTYYLWRFTSLEYEYIILPGEMIFEIIYSQRVRKKHYTASIKNMEKIAPVNGKDMRLSDIPGATREVFCASTRTGEGTWYAVVKEEGGGKTLLLFDLAPKGEKALRLQNPRAFL